MKKVIVILVLIIFSSIICESKVYKIEDIYNNIDKKICDVRESGIRLEFLTSKSLMDQLYIIENELNLNKNIFNEKNIKNNESYMFEKIKKDNKLKIIMNKEKDKLRVIIEIIHISDLIDMKKSKQLLEKLVDDTTMDKRYFSYLKGKIKENKSDIEELKSVIGKYHIENIETISLSSGTTGIISLKNNEKLNYSLMKYAKDTYLTIGSPVIFTTY